MIDIENEQIIPCREVPKYVPSRLPGRRVSPATIWRWLSRKTNPLESILIGGGRFTSVEAIYRFIGRAAPLPISQPSVRARAAGQKLKQLIGQPRDPKADDGTLGPTVALKGEISPQKQEKASHE